MPTICPVCKSDDRIERISAIVAVGTASGTYYDRDYSRRNVQTTTDLARILTPPVEPQLPFGHGWTKYGCMIPVIGFLAFYGGFWLLLAPRIVATGEQGAQSLLGVFYLGGVPSLFCLGLGLFAFILQAFMDRRNAQRHAIEHPRWKNAKERWDRLYFCHRDGIVFDPKPPPGAQETCLPQDLRTFIFS